MIITPEATQHDPQQMIAFYKKHFSHVHAVSCTKCRNTLALELSGALSNDTLGLTPNAQGIIVVPVDEKLLASRVRLDGMMGYQCGGRLPNPDYPEAKKAYEYNLKVYKKDYAQQVKDAKKAKEDEPIYSPPLLQVSETIPCDNDTRASAIEEAGSPTGGFHPHEVAAIHGTFHATGWKPPIAHENNKEYRDTFVAERV